jgi:ABC-type uncharacterized transport system permease subunit
MKREKKIKPRKMVNMSPYASSLLENRKLMIDKLRLKEGKPEITYTALLEVAIENMSIEMGVKK